MTDSETSIRVAIVDDHPMVREGLRAFLQLAADIDLVGEAATGEDAIRLAKQTDIDVILMDWLMPGPMDGEQAIRQIHAYDPTIHILVLSSSESPRDMRQSVSVGAIGYLQKTISPTALIGAIRQAAMGRSVLDRAALEALRSPLTEPVAPLGEFAFALTSREQSVLEQLAKGMSNKEIADALGISEKTVKVHASHIFAKLNVYDRTQAVIAASQRGLIRL